MEEEKKAATWYRRNKSFIWVCFKFLFIIGIFFLILTSKFVDGELISRFNATIAYFGSGILNLFGMATHSEGNVITGNGAQVKIVNICNGVHVTVLVAAAMLASPASWMHRTLGIAAAALTIYILNLGRCVSLFAINAFKREWFDFAHGYLWQAVVVLATLAIFMAWSIWAVPKDREAAG